MSVAQQTHGQDHNLLVSELQSLVVETKRRNPDVKDAGEHALELLKGEQLSSDALQSHSDALLAPITLGCKTKTAKIINISIAALQKLVALRGVPTSSLPGVLQSLASVANQGVDIQLRILQTLLSILTYNPDVHDEILGNALLLCFKLQDARVSVVSSTAAATLRQAVMLVFDRISPKTPGVEPIPTTALNLPTGPPTEVQSTPSQMDAFNIFSDLCLLTVASGSSGSGSGLLGWGAGEKQKPKLLKLSSLQRTFGLELIESILSGYEESVKQRPELLFLLTSSLDPLLLKLLAEKPTFPIALRICRLLFLLVRSFMQHLPQQVESYLLHLIRLGMGEVDNEAEGKKEAIMPWLRVLALETIRGISGDITLLQNLYIQFDSGSGSKLFAKIASSLSRLMNEKPILLGVCGQMQGLGIPATDVTSPHGGYLDMGIGMVASAASAGVSTVNSMIGTTGGGLGPHSVMKLRLIEQHDKAEAPIIPETYIYYLSLQSLNAIAEGIHTAASVKHPSVQGMAESAWPALLAALSFSIATNLSDSLFAEVLSALHGFTVACSVLQLDTPRDAFLNTLGKYSVPPPVVAAMQTYVENPTTRNASVISPEGLGLPAALGGGASLGPPSLSERNLACLKCTILTARLIGGNLGKSWHDVLEVLQNANFMLAVRRPTMTRRSTMASPQIGSSPAKLRGSSDEPRSEVFDGIDSDEIHLAINSLFDATAEMDDPAFTSFLFALCQLSSEMIGMENPSHDISDTMLSPMSPNPNSDNRRRTSGIAISTSIKSGDRSFSLGKLRAVAMMNLRRLVTKDPALGWDTVMQHLLAVARHLTAPSPVRIQASEILGDLLLGSMRSAEESRVQYQVFDVLVKQVDPLPISNIVSTDYDVRAAGYHTLNQILESSGHSLEVGWTTIFDMLNKVCKTPSPSQPAATAPSAIVPSTPSRATAYLRGDANLVRITFPSLNLICTDFLSSLDPEAMRQCISCLGYFGGQNEDVNISLASIGLMWNVSDAVQGNSSELWLYLLNQLLKLVGDTRLEVRRGATQTLFRCIELYGHNLGSDVWDDVWWKVIFPLLDSAKGDETLVLALGSIGVICHSFIGPLHSLASFDKIYQELLASLSQTFIAGPPPISTAALKALERVLQATTTIPSTESQSLLKQSWEAFVQMGDAMTSTATQAFTQDNLVALIAIARTLHDALELTESQQAQLSNVLISGMTYARSPEYRPDVDSMSPLQASIIQLTTSSSKLSLSLTLGALARFALLAFEPETILPVGVHGKLTFVALAKTSLPGIRTTLAASTSKGGVQGLYSDGTIQRVLKAYTIPLKLKYSCPPSNRFGTDPPLWRIALASALPVVEMVAKPLDASALSQEKYEVIWSAIMEIFAANLLADNSTETADDEHFIIPFLDRCKALISARLSDPRIPDRLIEEFSQTLQRSSQLYHYDARSDGGTTASVIPEPSEETRYWAFDLLISTCSRGADTRVAKLVSPALLQRFELSLRQFVDDAKLRGYLPLGRVREDELLYILRHLITLTLPLEDTSTQNPSASGKGSRAHLFRLYPLLLDLAFLPNPLPSMWIFPSEHTHLFTSATHGGVNGDLVPEPEVVDAGDAGDLIQVSAKDLARRCLELVGEELNSVLPV